MKYLALGRTSAGQMTSQNANLTKVQSYFVNKAGDLIQKRLLNGFYGFLIASKPWSNHNFPKAF